jgi:hypothetical protein
MTDRRSPGAESLSVFDQTLDRLLATSGYDREVQAQVLDAIRGGAVTMRDIAKTTGLALPTVQRAIVALAARDLVDTQPTPTPTAAPPRPSTPRRRKAPAPAPESPVAKTG